MEVDGVVPQTLGRLVALAAATLEGFPHTDLSAVAVLGVVFDAVHILMEEDKPEKNTHEILQFTSPFLFQEISFFPSKKQLLC